MLIEIKLQDILNEQLKLLLEIGLVFIVFLCINFVNFLIIDGHASRWAIRIFVSENGPCSRERTKSEDKKEKKTENQKR